MSNTKEIFEILSKDKLTVRDLLSVQYKASERTIPSDIIDNEYERHFSKNKQEYEDILDMDLTHLVRSYSKSLETKRLKNVYFLTLLKSRKHTKNRKNQA